MKGWFCGMQSYFSYVNTHSKKWFVVWENEVATMRYIETIWPNLRFLSLYLDCSVINLWFRDQWSGAYAWSNCRGQWLYCSCSEWFKRHSCPRRRGEWRPEFTSQDVRWNNKRPSGWTHHNTPHANYVIFGLIMDRVRYQKETKDKILLGHNCSCTKNVDGSWILSLGRCLFPLKVLFRMRYSGALSLTVQNLGRLPDMSHHNMSTFPVRPL